MPDPFVGQYISNGTGSLYERLRNVRVIGPFWSALFQATRADIDDRNWFSLRSLAEEDGTPELLGLSTYAVRNDGPGLQSETSLFVRNVGDGWLSDLKTFLGQNGKVIARRQIFEAERRIVVTPLADWPDDGSTQRLPPLKLVEGIVPIGITPRASQALQALLGGSQGTPLAGERLIYLTPEGVAFRARAALPSLGGDTEMNLWLLLTQDPAGPLEGDGPGRPVLRPWHAAPADIWPDTRTPELSLSPSKSRVQACFAEALGPFFAPGGIGTDDPKLFDLRLRRPLALRDYQWPLRMHVGTRPNAAVAMAGSTATPAIETRGEAIGLRLSERSISGEDPPKSSLLILPEVLTLTRNRAGDTVDLTAGTGSAVSGPAGTMTYAYARNPPVAEADEQAEHERVDVANLTLHVPIRSTRELLFGPEDGREDPTRRVFVPVTQGWVECDFPTLTVPELAKLGAPLADDVEPAAQSVGAMGIGNVENAGASFERVWNVTVRGAERIDLSIRYSLAAQRGIARSEITVRMAAPVIATSGLLCMVAMRPSETRLLPDHAERALTARAIEAADARALPRLEREALAQANVRIENVALTLVVRGDELKLDRAGFAYALRLPQDKAPRDRPTLWARHASLPTVQTQNLTQAGAERRTPSGTRELAPLAIESARIAFEGRPAFGIACTAGPLASLLDEELPGTDTKMTWNEQLGMAVTTLPSVTLMPLARNGLASDRRALDGWHIAPKGWGEGIRAAVRLRYDVALLDGPRANTELPDTEADVRLRYDVALLDGPRANTELPDTEADTENPATAAVFDTSVSRAAFVRARVHWQHQFSADVLSAVAWRGVLAKREDGPAGLRLANLGGGSFDIRSNVTPDVTLAPKDGTLGAYSLAISDGPTLELKGLPWPDGTPEESVASDVGGLSFELDGKTFLGGAAQLSAEDGLFEDQRGGRQSPASHNAAGWLDLTERAVSGVALEGTLKLVSTPTPLAFGEVSLWISDLGLREDGTWERDTLVKPGGEDGVSLMPNAHHPEHNVRVAHRWALIGPDGAGAGETGLALRGVLFRPIALSSALIDSAAGRAKFSIAGQIVMQVNSGDTQTPVAVGDAELTLERSADESPAVTLTAAKLTIPLADRRSVGREVAQVVLETVTFGSTQITVGGPARLELPMLGHFWSLPLDTITAEDGHKLTLEGSFAQDPDLRGIQPVSASVTFAGNAVGAEDSAQLIFSLSFGPDAGPRLAASGLRLDLMKHDALTADFGAVKLTVPGVPDETVTGNVAFTAAGAAIIWHVGDPDSVPVLPGLAISASRGWALGVLEEPGPALAVGAAPPEPQTAFEDWRMDLRHWTPGEDGEAKTELRLSASASEPKDATWRVSGTWRVTNEIHFPEPDAADPIAGQNDDDADMIEARFDQGFDTPLRHSAELLLVEHPISHDHLRRLAGHGAEDRADAGEAGLRLNMLALHSLRRENDVLFRWAQYQAVDVFDMPGLKARLNAIIGADEETSGWKDNKPSGLFSKAHAPELRAAIDGLKAGIALDFGVLPCLGQNAGGYRLCRLPAFGFVGAELAVNEALAAILNRAMPNAAITTRLPLVEDAIACEGPPDAQRKSRAAMLAGVSAQFSNERSEGHADFIDKALAVAKMPEWSTQALPNTRPYLAAGVGLKAALGDLDETRPALSLMPVSKDRATELKTIEGASPFFAALAEGRIETFAEARADFDAAPVAQADAEGHVLGISGATGALTNPRPYVGKAEQLADPDFRTYVLQVVDPSSSIGIVVPPDPGSKPMIARNVAAASATRIVKLPGAGGGALAPMERQKLALPFAHGFEMEAPVAAKRVALGVSLQEATSEILAYPEPDLGEDDDEIRPPALMRATRRSLRASFANTTTYFDGENAAAWLSEMSRPLFRAAGGAGEARPATIVFRAPENTPLPVAYDPAGGDVAPPPVPPPGEEAQAEGAPPEGPLPEGPAPAGPQPEGAQPDRPQPMYLPAGLTVSRISQGPGITYADRVGAAVFRDGALRARASAAPVFQRVSRTGQLGLRDHVRPSQFEAGHILLSQAPVTTLYGKGRPQPLGPDIPPPDADSAYRVSLTHPAGGILTPEWNRQLVLSFEHIGGSDDAQGSNKVDAKLVLGGEIYELSGGKDESLVQTLTAKADLTDAIARLTEVETAQLALTATLGGGFSRRLSLDLWAVGGDVPTLAERPLYVLFEDPTLDELTRGASHFVARSQATDTVLSATASESNGEEPVDETLSLRIATETEKITRTQSFTLVFGAIYPKKNTVVRDPLGVSSSWSMVRLRPSPDGTGRPQETDMGPLLRPNNKKPGDIPIFAKIEFDPTIDFIDRDALRVDDTLRIEWRLGTPTPISLLLYIQIVDRAPQSANPASYAVLQAELTSDRSLLRCSCPQHLESAEPSDRELVDAARLLQGTAIFRNRFRWRAFLPSDRSDRTDRLRWAVQKIDGQAGTWLPRDFAAAWARL